MHFWTPEALLETPEVLWKFAGDVSHRLISAVPPGHNQTSLPSFTSKVQDTL